jgi:thermitase
VLDTGIDAGQKDLTGKVIDRVSFLENENLEKEHGHGTFIAGIIAAANNSDAAGLAYNCSLMDVQVADAEGISDAGKVARGIIWAADHGAQVINVSIVISKPYSPLKDAVDYAWEKGCVIVAAAGNNNSTDPVYPAAYPNVIAVAATDKSDQLAGWSNRGDWVDVAAPGVEIYSSLPDNCYCYKSGSSFSTALVSAEAALLFNRAVDINNNSQINDEVCQYLLNNCDRIDGQDYP